MASPSFHLSRRNDIPARETLIVIHGLGGGERRWEEQLSSLTREYNVIIPHLPGLVDSTEYGSHTIERAISALFQVIDQIPMKTAHLCGISLGAFIAIHAALIRPFAVRSLILTGGDVNPSPILMLGQPAPGGMANTPYRQSPVAEALEDENERIFEAAKRDGNVFLPPPQIVASVRSVQDALSAIKVRTLAICGGRDLWNRKAAQKIAQGIPDSVLRILPDMDHKWYQEHPDIFVQIVGRFLGQLGKKTTL